MLLHYFIITNLRLPGVLLKKPMSSLFVIHEKITSRASCVKSAKLIFIGHTNIISVDIKIC